LFVPCGGLSWLLVSFLLHVKYTLSYRIVSYLRRLFQLGAACVSRSWQLVTSLILSRIDQCNSVLINLPALTTAPSQRVQNTAARLVFGLNRRHILLQLFGNYNGYLFAMKLPSRLPLSCTLFFTIGVHLSDFVQFATADDPGRSRLRSSTAREQQPLWTKTKLGNRPFSVAGSSTWNSLPPSLRLIDSHTHNSANSWKHICLNWREREGERERERVGSFLSAHQHKNRPFSAIAIRGIWLTVDYTV